MPSSIVQPIFTLGAARNGTTWLGNRLALHPDIACAQHELHHGIHESNLVAHYRYWGEFDTPDRYLSFLSQYQFEDYFKILEGEVNYFLENPQKDFFHFFCVLMDRFCVRHGYSFWTTKLDPDFSLHPDLWRKFELLLETRYDKIHFISIQRELLPCMRSYVYMEGEHYASRTSPLGTYLALPLGVARYATQYRWINEVIRKHRGLKLEFNLVVRDPDLLDPQLIHHLGLSGKTTPVEDIYQPNTSFVGSRPKDLNGFQSSLVKIASTVFSFVPGLGVIMYRTYEKLKPARDPVYRKILKSLYFQEKFREELKAINAKGL